MRFAQLHIVYVFWLIIGLILFLIWAFKKRQRALEIFAEKQLLKELIYSLDVKKRHLKAYLIVLALVMGIFSLMRPQWGFHWTEVKRMGLDILIAVDTSKSMLATDVQPNRLERSKLAVKDLIRKLKGDRIGLIAFSGTAFLQCPLTVDYNGFLLSLEDLTADTIPRPGTSISTAIKEAIKSYKGGQNKYKILVIITDGEDHEGDPIRAAEEAKKEGIVIFCIGIGTKEGEIIPIIDETGNKIFLKDKEGNVVKSKLDEATLQKIALTTGGSYVHATLTEFGLDLLYEEKLSKMEKRELEGKMVKNYEERFQIPLGIALVLLLLEMAIGERRHGT